MHCCHATCHVSHLTSHEFMEWRMMQGWCGVGPRFCAVGKCISGACDGSKKPTPNPQPKPQPGMHVVEMWYGGTARLRCVGGRVITQLWGIRYGNPAKKCSSPVAPK